MLEKYSFEVERLMRLHYASLPERGKRHYAGLEALKLGFGGKKYICSLFEMSHNTLRKGILELRLGESCYTELGTRQRALGGGRKSFFLLN